MTCAVRYPRIIVSFAITCITLAAPSTFATTLVTNTSVDWQIQPAGAVDGSTIKITVKSICVHGDSPGAVDIARAVRDRLTAENVQIEAFC